MHLRRNGFLGLALIALIVSSCAWLNPPPPKPRVAKEKAHTPAVFIEHLALARIGLDSGASDTSTIAPDLEVMQDYMAQRPQKLKRRQSVLIVTYQNNSDERNEAVVPVPTKPYTVEFPALLEVMRKLNSESYTLHDLSMATTSVVPTDAFKKSGSDIDQTRIALEQQHQWLMNNSEALPPLDDAQAQLQLAGFFIEYRFRDAAYLSVDNVKRLLASASNQKANKATIRILSKKLETLEELLHKTMPFTL